MAEAYTYDPHNPIETVDGAYVPSPSKYDVGHQDVSAADSGRTEDGLMHKKMIGTKVKLELAWNNISDADVAMVLTAFNHEYVTVKYKDPLACGYLTKEFYCGDRHTASYNSKLGVWSTNFNIIER